MRSPAVLVCERTGAWADAIRHALATSGLDPLPRIVETRSPAECRAGWEARDERTAPLVVEWRREGAEEVCELLALHGRRRPRAPRFVVGLRDVAAWEFVLREAGATSIVDSPRELRPLIETLRRYLAGGANEREDDDADEEIPITARIGAALPWRPAESSSGHIQKKV